MKTPAVVLTVQENLKARCPLGPPYFMLVLDEASVRLLAAGAVNARCEVEAHRVLTEWEAASLPQRKKRA